MVRSCREEECPVLDYVMRVVSVDSKTIEASEVARHWVWVPAVPEALGPPYLL